MATAQALKHWLIPSQHNKYHPHLIKPKSLALTLCLVLMIQLSSSVLIQGAKVLGFATDVNVNSIYNTINTKRALNKLNILSLNSQLSQAANNKAQDMLANNYWAHISPSGKTPWSFINSAGYEYDYAGENLAKDFNSSDGVVSGWMASRAHRDNLLSTKYSDIGVAVVNGRIEGKDTTLVVTLYGYPHSATTLLNSLLPSASANAPETVSSPPVTNYNLLNSISLESVANYSIYVIIVLLIFFVLVYLNDHRVKVKFSLPRDHHSHSLLQAILLLCTLLLIVFKVSFGMVG